MAHSARDAIEILVDAGVMSEFLPMLCLKVSHSTNVGQVEGLKRVETICCPRPAREQDRANTRGREPPITFLIPRSPCGALRREIAEDIQHHMRRVPPVRGDGPLA